MRLTDRPWWGGALALCNEGKEVGLGLNSAGTVECEEGKDVCRRVDLRDGPGEGVTFELVGGVKGRWEDLGGRGG